MVRAGVPMLWLRGISRLPACSDLPVVEFGVLEGCFEHQRVYGPNVQTELDGVELHAQELEVADRSFCQDEGHDAEPGQAVAVAEKRREMRSVAIFRDSPSSAAARLRLPVAPAKSAGPIP